MHARVLSGWGRYPREQCEILRPSADRVVDAIRERVIARGLGRAYGDSALSSRVLVTTRADRFLGFDDSTGRLHVEAGVSIDEIIRVLLERGWFIPVTPGTKFVTIGGAIAADVHGKNHHVDGTLSAFVDEIELLLASGEVRWLTPDGENRELFWATVGGMGLTGVILSARLRLRRIETSYFHVRYVPSPDLDRALENIQATNDIYRYSVAWVDCLARGRSLGRSLLMLSNEARVSDLPRKMARTPLRQSSGRSLGVPFDLPEFVLSPFSVRVFNTLYYAAGRKTTRWVHFDSFYYPLDQISDWNRIYGRRGFIQYQALLPQEQTRSGLIALLERIADSGLASFLAVLKACGPANPSPLSFPYPGYTLALDLPFSDAIPDLAKELDRILLRHGGRLYLAKDALMSAATFAEMYPRTDELRRIKAEVDPEGRFTSSQAERLQIA